MMAIGHAPMKRRSNCSNSAVASNSPNHICAMSMDGVDVLERKMKIFEQTPRREKEKEERGGDRTRQAWTWMGTKIGT